MNIQIAKDIPVNVAHFLDEKLLLNRGFPSTCDIAFSLKRDFRDREIIVAEIHDPFGVDLTTELSIEDVLSYNYLHILYSKWGNAVSEGKLLSPRENRIREELIAVAREASRGGLGLISYSHVGDMVGLDMNKIEDRIEISYILDRISSFEHNAGRPLLSAVVVHQQDEELTSPGGGFYDLARKLGLLKGRKGSNDIYFFAEELKRVHETFARPPGLIVRELRLSKITTFESISLSFSKSLNVIIGENGTGKTHILKIIYSILYAMHEDDPNRDVNHLIIRKLMGVFKPDNINRLIRRTDEVPGLSFGDIELKFISEDNKKSNLSFSLTSGSNLRKTYNDFRGVARIPIYLPTHDVLSVIPGFVSYYDSHESVMDETWRDLCSILGQPVLKNVNRELLDILEDALQGHIEKQDDKFYLVNNISNKIEMPLLAEGLRKISTLALLISNGSLSQNATIIWDEPETGLNPKLVKILARIIVALSNSGIQIFIATHSLFLLREIHIIEKHSKIDARYFGLHKGVNGVEVHQGNSVNEIGDISILEEELSQADRYINTENQTRPSKL